MKGGPRGGKGGGGLEAVIHHLQRGHGWLNIQFDVAPVFNWAHTGPGGASAAAVESGRTGLERGQTARTLTLARAIESASERARLK